MISSRRILMRQGGILKNDLLGRGSATSDVVGLLSRRSQCIKEAKFYQVSLERWFWITCTPTDHLALSS